MKRLPQVHTASIRAGSRASRTASNLSLSHLKILTTFPPSGSRACLFPFSLSIPSLFYSLLCLGAVLLGEDGEANPLDLGTNGFCLGFPSCWNSS